MVIVIAGDFGKGLDPTLGRGRLLVVKTDEYCSFRMSALPFESNRVPWQVNDTIATMNTEYCVALCYYKGGHSLPWSQPSWIHRWIVVINLNGPNGSRRSTCMDTPPAHNQSLTV